MDFKKNKKIIIGGFLAFVVVAWSAFFVVRRSYFVEREKMEPYVLSNQALRNAVYDSIGAIHSELYADGKYYLPTEEWVLKSFYPAFKKDLFENNNVVYRPEANDCDDYSLYAIAFAKRYFNRGRTVKMPIAFGEFVYRVKNSTNNHAINIVAIQRGNSDQEIMFFEPQTGRFIELTEEEKFSGYFVRF